MTRISDWGLSSLMYVSRSALRIDGDADGVEQIVKTAAARNGSLQITGALIYTELHFAQVLEGPIQAVEKVMSSIRRDERHQDVTIVLNHRISARRFPDWEMAYMGRFPYLDRQVKPLLSPMLTADEKIRMGQQLASNIEKLQVDAIHSR